MVALLECTFVENRRENPNQGLYIYRDTNTDHSKSQTFYLKTMKALELVTTGRCKAAGHMAFEVLEVQLSTLGNYLIFRPTEF